VKVTATLDEAARTRFGLDVGPALAGPMPMKFSGRVGSDDREGRFSVEADLTNTKTRICCRLGQGAGPAGARGVHPDQAENQWLRFEDVLIDGQGVPRQGHGRSRQRRRPAGGELSVFATSDGD
jgi:hypothetical protein